MNVYDLSDRFLIGALDLAFANTAAVRRSASVFESAGRGELNDESIAERLEPYGVLFCAAVNGAAAPETRFFYAAANAVEDKSGFDKKTRAGFAQGSDLNGAGKITEINLPAVSGESPPHIFPSNVGGNKVYLSGIAAAADNGYGSLLFESSKARERIPFSSKDSPISGVYRQTVHGTAFSSSKTVEKAFEKTLPADSPSVFFYTEPYTAAEAYSAVPFYGGYSGGKANLPQADRDPSRALDMQRRLKYGARLSESLYHNAERTCARYADCFAAAAAVKNAPALSGTVRGNEGGFGYIESSAYASAPKFVQRLFSAGSAFFGNAAGSAAYVGEEPPKTLNAEIEFAKKIESAAAVFSAPKKRDGSPHIFANRVYARYGGLRDGTALPSAAENVSAYTEYHTLRNAYGFGLEESAALTERRAAPPMRPFYAGREVFLGNAVSSVGFGISQNETADLREAAAAPDILNNTSEIRIEAPDMREHTISETKIDMDEVISYITDAVAETLEIISERA